ncbi:hypothetical protein Esti_005946 [Eimeria stiedai]
MFTGTSSQRIERKAHGNLTLEPSSNDFAEALAVHSSTEESEVYPEKPARKRPLPETPTEIFKLLQSCACSVTHEAVPGTSAFRRIGLCTWSVLTIVCGKVRTRDVGPRWRKTNVKELVEIVRRWMLVMEEFEAGSALNELLDFGPAWLLIKMHYLELEGNFVHLRRPGTMHLLGLGYAGIGKQDARVGLRTSSSVFEALQNV